MLQAVIGKDGAVRELRVISGHPMLNQAAIEAVKRWRYAPIGFQGILTVTVNFTLT